MYHHPLLLLSTLQAALQAYQKDLSQMLGLPVDEDGGDTVAPLTLPASCERSEQTEVQLQQLQQIQQFISLQKQRDEKKQLEEFIVSQKRKVALEMGYEPSDLDLPMSSEPVPPPAPPQWVEATSPEGHTYYYNVLTGGNGGGGVTCLGFLRCKSINLCDHVRSIRIR